MARAIAQTVRRPQMMLLIASEYFTLYPAQTIGNEIDWTTVKVFHCNMQSGPPGNKRTGLLDQ
ncbi:hypothetical protein CA833_21445 [Novosphingobium sp. KA1]|nr:hypothetical protein CA833_21445 [Novosphingobium sp. KA1]